MPQPEMDLTAQTIEVQTSSTGGDVVNMHVLKAGRTYQNIRNVSFSELSCLSCPLKYLS